MDIGAVAERKKTRDDGLDERSWVDRLADCILAQLHMPHLDRSL